MTTKKSDDALEKEYLESVFANYRDNAKRIAFKAFYYNHHELIHVEYIVKEFTENLIGLVEFLKTEEANIKRLQGLQIGRL